MTGFRRDAVVILARGQGVRMGGPKAGLKLQGESRTFLEMVIDVYAGRGWPLTVVFGPRGPGAVVVPDGVRVLEGPAGGDTARTLFTAWGADAPLPAPPTHYWAHPVDLPLVAVRTIARLAEASRSAPRAVVRPFFGGRPGHPVVIPRAVVREAAADPGCRDLAFGEVLERRPGPFREVAVPDAGVVRDFDEPDDLAAWRPEGDTT